MRVLAILVLVVGTTRCSLGLGETPRTLPPGKLSGTVGMALVLNENDSARGSVGLQNFAPQLGPIRVGIAPRVDVGIASLYGLGARADAKVALTRPTLKWALAVRAGGGYAADLGGRRAALAFAGVIASYSAGAFEPYAAVTFANHWIYGSPVNIPPPGGRNAPRAGYGDGLLQLVAGVRVYVANEGSVSLEYGRWQPMQDDPGDGYSFVANNIGSVIVCFGCWSRRASLAAVGVTEDGYVIKR